VTTTAAPRVQPGDRRAVGLVAWVVAQVSGRVTGTTPPNLFLVLGRHRRLFRGWLHFAGRLMPGGSLPRRETELVILRVAHLRDSAYELDQHRRLAARAGLDEAEVARALEGAAAPGWTRREAVILAAVDELHASQDLADATWDELRACLSEREAIELVLLVGHYEMLATAITALRVPPDQPRRSRG
jgi:AhpD family alkylhydroperoxidase